MQHQSRGLFRSACSQRIFMNRSNLANIWLAGIEPKVEATLQGASRKEARSISAFGGIGFFRGYWSRFLTPADPTEVSAFFSCPYACLGSEIPFYSFRNPGIISWLASLSGSINSYWYHMYGRSPSEPCQPPASKSSRLSNSDPISMPPLLAASSRTHTNEEKVSRAQLWLLT